MRKRRGKTGGRRSRDEYQVTEWKEEQEDEEGDEKEESGGRPFNLICGGNDPLNFVSSFAHRSRRGENEAMEHAEFSSRLDERNVFEPSRVESDVLNSNSHYNTRTFNRGEAVSEC